ncbi:MAG: hypothetical protein OXL37_17255 [Chloroflexota bacterium]|nr:hypothetical protein [Chloroflexota bacterium]MDE2960909.1 hypothetical protein [Chloroflexota bacterium]
MSTVAKLGKIRVALIEQGYSAEMVDAMLDLLGIMMLERSLASKEEVKTLQDELTRFKIDVIDRFAQLRIDMRREITDLRIEMNQKLVQQGA